MTAIPPSVAPGQHPTLSAQDVSKLREVAVELEATFLAEMLKAAGLGEMKGEFSGGTGESQFASFLRTEQAREMARTGGIGLAEQVFDSLKGRLNG